MIILILLELGRSVQEEEAWCRGRREREPDLAKTKTAVPTQTRQATEYTAAGSGLMKTTIASLPTRALSLLACWKRKQENSLGSEFSLKMSSDGLTVETFSNSVSSMVTLSFSQVDSQ